MSLETVCETLNRNNNTYIYSAENNTIIVKNIYFYKKYGTIIPPDNMPHLVYLLKLKYKKMEKINWPEDLKMINSLDDNEIKELEEYVFIHSCGNENYEF